MKKAFSLILLGMICLSLNGANADAGVNNRQQSQRGRLTQGIKSGELTRGETKSLINGQKRIAKMEQQFKSDGTLTPKERARLQHAQNIQSQKIFRAKHNPRDRH